MRRTVLLLASVALTVLLVSGVAYAAIVNCVAGEDFCVGTNKADTVNGSEVRDKIFGQDGEDKLYGNVGNDGVNGGKGADILEGGGDRDTLNGGTGNDTMKGGPGDDTLDFSDGNGTDKLYGQAGNDELTDYSANYSSLAVPFSPNVLSGGNGDDYLTGHNRLYGGSGNDRLWGFSYWNEKGITRTFKPGPGEDRVSSDNNTNDTVYAVDGERDTIACGGGQDTVYFDKGIDSVNPANCEKRIGK